MSDAGKSADEKFAKNKKKPYEKPRLETYGDIREITKAGGVMGMMDNALGVLRSR
jgi:hypothetical protein